LKALDSFAAPFIFFGKKSTVTLQNFGLTSSMGVSESMKFVGCSVVTRSGAFEIEVYCFGRVLNE
jgi:hypothetical protein